MAGSNPGLHKLHRHMVSGVLAAVSGIGLIVAAVCILMYKTEAYEGPPWHALAIVIGISSALALAFVALRRGWEDS